MKFIFYIAPLLFWVVASYSRADSERDYGVDQYQKIITNDQAIHDIKQLENLIDRWSSYARLSGYDYKTDLHILEKQLKHSRYPIKSVEFSRKLARVIYSLGDRHSMVSFGTGENSYCKKCSGYFPLALAHYQGSVLALNWDSDLNVYRYVDNDYPYVKRINGVDVWAFVERYSFRHQFVADNIKGPRSLFEFNILPMAYFMAEDKVVDIEMANNKGQTLKRQFPFSKKFSAYRSKASIDKTVLDRQVRNNDYASLVSVLESNIGYVRLPRMYNDRDVGGVDRFTENVYQTVKNTRALIIDVRANGGGRRSLIKSFAAFIVPPNTSPWLANVAYSRSDGPKIRKRLADRFLFPSDAEIFFRSDRQAIDRFNTEFKPTVEFDKTLFSEPFYTLLRSGPVHYDKPVYILADDETFSAASIFVAAFKALPNVKVVGTVTDGSSGKSKAFTLNHSGVTVKLSTMISLQRNGVPFDGYGTAPDLDLEVDLSQVLHHRDSQLNALTSYLVKALD